MEKKKKKAGLKRKKGAVIYVRVMENNAGGRRSTKVSLLCVLGLNKTPGCLFEEGRMVFPAAEACVVFLHLW